MKTDILNLTSTTFYVFFIVIAFLYIFFKMMTFLISIDTNDKNKNSDIDGIIKKSKEFDKPTIEYKLKIDKYQAYDDIENPDGLYIGNLKSDLGNVEIGYLFYDGNKVLKEINSTYKTRKGDVELMASGIADYKVVGQTLIFSNVIGDKSLFSIIGEVFKLKNDQVKLFFDSEVEEVSKFVLEKQVTNIKTNNGD